VAKEPTEFEEGLMTYTCGDCAHTKGEPIAKLDHELTFVPANDPTCTEDGNTAHYFCQGCKRYYRDEAGTAEIGAADVIREKLDHDWSEWRDTGSNAVADVHERSCKRENCDAKELENHKWSAWTSIGDEEHQKTCSVCLGSRTAAHNWDDGVETTPATCHSTGVMTYTCNDCGHKKTEEIPAAAPAAPVEAPSAPGTAGQLKLYNVEPKTAAMIMAIVANKLGKPLNELRFLSIREVEE
jgi:DNA-directed RNA polymerase subunit RPC12/RpoP